MLTKSAARLFFFGGTLLFSGVFLALTIDSLRTIPSQTHTENLSDAVRRGHHVWDKNNCMGCHTLLGEGAYYAPELTKVYDRRGAEWMRIFLKDPEAMFPNQRKMVKYDFSPQEIEDLIAFFKWIGEIDTNGFPPKPVLAMAPPAPSAAGASSGAAGKTPDKFAQICVACHSLKGQGGTVGPALDTVGSRLTADYLDRWLTNPQAIKPGTQMPQLPMTDAERAELVAFLLAQKGGAQ